MRKSRIWAGVTAALLATALVGCTSMSTGVEQGSSTSALREETITVQDGRTVHCVVYSSGYKGGLSCDWEGAR